MKFTFITNLRNSRNKLMNMDSMQLQKHVKIDDIKENNRALEEKYYSIDPKTESKTKNTTVKFNDEFTSLKLPDYSKGKHCEANIEAVITVVHSICVFTGDAIIDRMSEEAIGFILSHSKATNETVQVLYIFRSFASETGLVAACIERALGEKMNMFGKSVMEMVGGD